MSAEEARHDDEDEVDEEEATEEEKAAIVRSFLLQAPPGELFQVANGASEIRVALSPHPSYQQTV